MLTDYILTYDDVRAVLGLGVKELSDQALQAPIFELTVETVLTGVYDGMLDLYATLVKKKADNTADPQVNPPLTKAERKILGLTQIISTYAAANTVNIGMTGLKRITDGKAEQERFSDAFRGMKEDTQNLLYDYLAMLRAALLAYEIVLPTVAFRFPTAIATLGTDPVTGE